MSEVNSHEEKSYASDASGALVWGYLGSAQTIESKFFTSLESASQPYMMIFHKLTTVYCARYTWR